MSDFLELFSALCIVFLLFATARIGWVAGFYIYHAIAELSDSIANSLVNFFKKAKG